MAYEIFISHSTKDKAEADAVCRALEEAGMKCWIAPRDILPGQDWREAIVNAIINCRIFLLIHSENSNASKDVAKEIALAANQEKLFTLLKIKKAELPKILQYSLSDEALVDGVNLTRQERIKKLVEKAKSLEKNGKTGERVGIKQEQGSQKTANLTTGDRGKSSILTGKKMGILYSVVGMVIIIGAWFFFNTTPQTEETSIIEKVDAGFDHSLVLLNNGELYVFGGNDNGQLGLGDQESRTEPELLEGLKNVKTFSAGRYYTLVLLNSGEVYAFGNNRMAQLGLGDTRERHSPEKINIPDPVNDISAGGFHSLFLLENGEVYACGSNYVGQLGIDSTTTISITTPVKIEIGGKAKAIAAGYDFSLVLLENGDVYSFGNGDSGRLGHGDYSRQIKPKKIETLSNVMAIAAGNHHSLALTEEGLVYSFGFGNGGQLGHGDKTTRVQPTRIIDISDVSAIAAGRNHSLALTDTGQLYVFGTNSNSALGLVDIDEQLRPKQVEELPPIRTISAGYQHNIILCEENVVYSFGSGDKGQLGLGDNAEFAAPAVVNFFEVLKEAGESYLINENDTAENNHENDTGTIKNETGDLESNSNQDWAHLLNIDAGIIVTEGDWVYYTGHTGNQRLHRIRTDGSDLAKLSDDRTDYFQIAGDWIYYINNDRSRLLYKVSTEGTNRSQFTSHRTGTMVATDEWIFYTNLDDSGRIWRIKTDGSNQSRIADDSAVALYILDDWLYYNNVDDSYRKYMIRFDGSERKPLQ